ncbi:MAG: hypothetical protein Q8O40_13800 [Chloroflexota bacterium]|nr:hypothetical protein [Chloroflexota bacterium]
MTNTLHRYGSRESLTDDYIVFTMPSGGINDEGAEPRLRAFLEAAVRRHPVNVGLASQGLYRPSKSLNLFSAYLRPRKHGVTPEQALNEASTGNVGTVAAVFDNKNAFEAFIADVKRLDLGFSVNASAIVDDTRCACRNAGFQPHSVEYSLGFRGRLDKLPDGRVLELSTMCGHGMVSANYAQKMMMMVKEGRLKPERASQYMAKFCTCGVFNPSRAVRILEEARKGVRIARVA